MQIETTEESITMSVGDRTFYYGPDLAQTENVFKYSTNGTPVAVYTFSELGSSDEGDLAMNLLYGIGKLHEEVDATF